jgi:hypothetical protein
MIDANRLASGIVRVDDGRGFYHGLEELECCAQCDTANVRSVKTARGGIQKIKAQPDDISVPED